MSQIPRIVAVIRDEATQSFSVEIEFRDVYRVIRSICVPRALVDDPRKLMIELKNAGANIRDIANTKKVFIQLKESEQKAKQIVLAKSLGWRKDGTFVSLTSTIGRKGCPEEVIRRPRSQLYQKARKRGSLRAWKRTVATPALYSSPLVFCLSATFAATTLRMSDLNSFGIMLVAPTKSGKSTIQLAAGSVIGFRKESHLPNFQCSDPALQELITAFSDHPVIVNEGELLAGDLKWRASRLNSLAYQLAEGRSKSFSKTISRPQTWYRTIFMGSLENSFRTDLERLQTIGASGSTARLIELPAASNKDPIYLIEHRVH